MVLAARGGRGGAGPLCALAVAALHPSPRALEELSSRQQCLLDRAGRAEREAREAFELLHEGVDLAAPNDAPE